MINSKRECLLRGNPAYLHVILPDLEEVEEAPGLGNVILIDDSWVRLGQVVGVVLPGDFYGLPSERG